MKSRIIEGHSVEIFNRSEMTADVLSDIREATLAREHALSPQFHYKVGTCLRTHDDRIWIGWNFENDIGITLHAEINALGQITAPSRALGIKRITVVTGHEEPKRGEKPGVVCGMCAQILSKFVRPHDDPEVIMTMVRGEVYHLSLKDIVPHAFRL